MTDLRKYALEAYALGRRLGREQILQDHTYWDSRGPHDTWATDAIMRPAVASLVSARDSLLLQVEDWINDLASEFDEGFHAGMVDAFDALESRPR